MLRTRKSRVFNFVNNYFTVGRTFKCTLHQGCKRYQNMDHPLVEITQGKLRGTVAQDMDGKNFYSFRGIPYAEPPLGKLRFRAPVPSKPWQGILDATKDGHCCYSKSVFKKEMVGSEDCLNLNVYTPILPTATNELLPVMVWIHGGGYMCGSGEFQAYGPQFLIPENVVVVTMNYRLGLLGFLSLDDPSAKIPGNAGFKDMVMVLKWVNTNISHFSGDPNNVTIFGESVGGVAVHLLVLSSMARGLFHKAIAQSGSALNPWSRAKKADSDVFKAFGCEGKSEVELAEFLENLPVEKLLEGQAKLDYFIDPSFLNYYGVVIERRADEQAEIPFLSEEPVDILLSKSYSNVPLIMGYANLEGLVVNTYSEKRVQLMLTNFERNIPHFLGYKSGTKESRLLAEKIKQHYYGNNTPNRSSRDLLYEMVTDHYVMYGIYAAVRMYVLLDHPVYFYRMSLVTSLKFLQAAMKIDKDKGAAHGDDVAYLFKTIFTPTLSPDSIEYRSIKTFVKLWTNFAYCGNPTPDPSVVTWKKATREEIGSMEIDKELKFGKFYEKNLAFWDKVYAESPSGQKFVERRSKL